MALDDRPYNFDRVIRIIATTGVFIGLVWLAGYLSDVLIPFAVALLIAYLINPLVVRIQKKIRNRSAAVFVALLLVLAAMVLVAVVIIPLVAGEVSQMGRIVSQIAEDSKIAQRAAEYLPSQIWQSIKDFVTRPEIQRFFDTERLIDTLRAGAEKILPGVWGLITGTASFLLGLLGLAVIGLYLVFLLLDYEKITQGWKDLIPADYRDAVVGFVGDFEAAMASYFRGQAAVAAICGILFAVGFALIGLPLGILLGLFVGLLNMVPYLQTIGLIPAFLLALFHSLETGTSLWVVLALTGLVFVLVQVIQDAFLVPKIMGKVTGLNPAMILLSLSIWGKLLGLLGLIIALPATYLLLVYYRRLIHGPSPAAAVE
jgi:predicted PurR-regulated permease PerM